MSGLLLDTNVLSELRKANRCDAEVRQWFEEAVSEEQFNDLVVVSREEDGYRKTGVRLINLFSKPKPAGS